MEECAANGGIHVVYISKVDLFAFRLINYFVRPSQSFKMHLLSILISYCRTIYHQNFNK